MSGATEELRREPAEARLRQLMHVSPAALAAMTIEQLRVRIADCEAQLAYYAAMGLDDAGAPEGGTARP
jgi:hypothetical protein